MAIKNYIWDFDGMLFDTYPHTLACFVETYRRRGIEIDGDEAYRLFKITMWDAFDFYKTDEATKREFYELENDISFPPEGLPYPFIPETLRFIRSTAAKAFCSPTVTALRCGISKNTAWTNILRNLSRVK